MHKVIPPRLVEPYLTGRRSIISGFVYLAADSSFLHPADFYHACGLGFDGSDFSSDAEELYLLRWRTIGTEPLQVASPPGAGQRAAGTGGTPARVRAVTEFHTDPVPVPVGTEIFRVRAGQADFIARYDGQVWLHPAEGS